MGPILRVLYPLYDQLTIVRDLPKGQLTSNGTRVLTRVLMRLVRRRRRNGIRERVLITRPNSTVRSLEILPARVSERRVALVFRALKSRDLLPERVTSTTVELLTTIRSHERRRRIIIALRSDLCRTERVATLSTNLISASTRQLRTQRVRRRVICRVTRLAVVVHSSSKTRTRTILSARQVVERRDVRLTVVLVQRVLRTCSFCVRLRVTRTFYGPLHAKRISTFPRRLIRFIFICGLF